MDVADWLLKYFDIRSLYALMPMTYIKRTCCKHNFTFMNVNICFRTVWLTSIYLQPAAGLWSRSDGVELLQILGCVTKKNTI